MRRACLALLALAGFAAGARGADSSRPAAPPPAAGPKVELPPMLVEESVSRVPWLYAQAGGIEFLSRCSASTTRALAEAWLAKLQLVRAFVPGQFLARVDTPAVFVLYAQDLEHTVSAEIQRELRRDAGRPGGVDIAPSMRLSDRDMTASIAYIDEALFDAATLGVSPSHVRFLLDGRVPELPGWFAEGIERTYRRADFILDPITLNPLVWLNSAESDALSADAARPRTLLPAPELFAPEAARAVEQRHPRRLAVRTATQELFVRWAIASGEPTRAALWQFAALAAAGPVTEAQFEAAFGFGYAELRDRLSDYLPAAVNETNWFSPGKLPPAPVVEIERATPNQIARVRGEWERLAIGHVQRRLPEAREPYLAQARRTLRRAFDAGDRDPRLLASLGLLEVDAGNDPAAVPFLEPAVATGVVRPRAYHELARIRFDALHASASQTRVFSFTELAPVIAPLRRAITQAPPLPETYALLGEAWARCETAPNSDEFAELLAGARHFWRRPEVAYPLALALARHGRKADATAVLDACAGHAEDPPTRAGIAGLRRELAAPAP